MTSSRLHVRPFSAGYGGVGPATRPPQPDLWLVLFVELESSAQLRAVEIASVELLDDGGAVVARARPDGQLQCEPADADRAGWDFSFGAALPFDGYVEPGQRLRLSLRAALDTRAESLKAAPTRFRARLAAANDPGVTVEGPLEPPWPTA